jgi:glycine cleavage system H protein
VKETLQEYQDGLLWKVEEDNFLTMGVTQSAIDQAGAVQSLEFADAGDEFEAGDWIGEVNGKDSLVEIVAPCRLRITERNQEMIENPAILEDDPTGDAWMLRAERLDD